MSEDPFVIEGKTGLAKLKYYRPPIPRKHKSDHLIAHDRAVFLRKLAQEFEDTYSDTQLAQYNVWRQTERMRHEARARRRAMNGGITFTELSGMGTEIVEGPGLGNYTEDSENEIKELTAAVSYSINKVLGTRTALMELFEKQKKNGAPLSELFGEHFTEYVPALIKPAAKLVGAPAGIVEQSLRVMAQECNSGFVSWTSWERIMWRLAGCASKMARGIACSAAYRLVEPEWAPVVVESCSRTVNPDNTVAHILSMRVLGGALSGGVLHHVFPPKALWFMHKVAFTLPRIPKDRKLTMHWFLGMRCWVCLEPTTPPSFHHVAGNSATSDFNRKLFNGRLKPCPEGRQTSCYNCSNGIKQCQFATHVRPIIVKPCTACNDAEAEFYVGDDETKGCIGCRTRRKFLQEKTNAGRGVFDGDS